MRSLKNNKKGSIMDVLFIAGLALFFAMTVLIGFKFMSEFNDVLQADDQVTADGKAATQELTNFYPGVIDGSFLLFIVGLAIGTFVLAALVRISPIFLAIYLIALIFVIFFAGIMSNIYQTMAENPEMIAQADQLLFTSHILEYLPIIVGVFGTLLALIMYKSYRDVQGV